LVDIWGSYGQEFGVLFFETQWSHHEEKKSLEKDIMQGAMPDAPGRIRPRTAWIYNIKTWTGLLVEKSIRMIEGTDKWRKYVQGVANPRIEDS